jgi:hypothetical protein
LIPSLDPKKIIEENPDLKPAVMEVKEVLNQLKMDIEDAKDNLTAAKIQQSFHANKHRRQDDVYKVGDKVMLNTLHRRKEYINGKPGRVAKFLPRFDGPFTVTKIHPLFSMYEIDMPNNPNSFPVFHASELKRHVANDGNLFPSREFARPGPVLMENGEEEWAVEKIIDERRRGRGKQYLVKWIGYGDEENRWLPGRDLDDCEALDRWEKDKVEGNER